MQDVLLCIQTGKTVDDTKRMKFQTQEFYLKSEEEMRQLFPNCPEALENTEVFLNSKAPPLVAETELALKSVNVSSTEWEKIAVFSPETTMFSCVYSTLEYVVSAACAPAVM